MKTERMATDRYGWQRMPRIGFVVVVASVSCASTGGLEQRVAQLEGQLRAVRSAGQASPAAPIDAAEAVALGNLAAAATVPTFVAFVDERPALCKGALCWVIENGHGNPVRLSINGQPVLTVGWQGDFLPAGSRAYIRLVDPGHYTLGYELRDSVSVGDGSPEFPVATVLARCRAEGYIGGSVDAYWSGHTTRLDHSFCYVGAALGDRH